MHDTSFEIYATNDEIAKARKTPKHLNTEKSHLIQHEPEKGAAAAKPPPPPFWVDIASADFFRCSGV